MMEDGKLFQSLIDLEKKLCWYEWVDEFGRIKRCGLIHQVLTYNQDLHIVQQRNRVT